MQSTYDALQKDFDNTRATLQQRESENADLKAALDNEKSSLDKEKATSRELGNQIKNLQAELERAIKTREALEAEKSAMLSDTSRLQASIEEMKSALADLARRKAEADARIAEFKSLLGRFKSLIDAGKLRVKMADGRMVVELASDVLFASGSANLSKDGRASIAEVAQLLAEIPDRKFQIEGHTDNVPISTAQYPSNWELASARAVTVLKTMVDAGMPIERISAASYGDSKPALPNDTSEGRAANRRIEIVVVPDLSSLPGFEELNRVSGH
ncbi:MAG TPA: endoflagellar motor protein [Myxococcales bacterium]|nr:endoflagellar motor protein [Myxococcales bacterium]